MDAAEGLVRLKAYMPDHVQALLVHSANEVVARVGEWFGPSVLAHRDFTPWNIRASDAGLYVFDWEYAADGRNPLFDVFHFHTICRALSRSRRLSAV